MGPTPGHLGVVVDHDAPVAGRVDVQLDAVGIEHHGAAEGGAGVLVLVSRSAAMGDHARSWHGPKGSPP